MNRDPKHLTCPVDAGRLGGLTRASALALVVLAAPAWAQPAPAVLQAPAAGVPSAPPAVDSEGGTYVPVATELTSLLSDGGVPESLEQLKSLEQQQQRVADAATFCTVSVQIGDAQGCGVIVTGTGLVMTAAHVAMRPKMRAKVTLSDGRVVLARTLGMNRNVDAGLIRIDPGQNNGREWPHATVGTSKNLVPGMWCVATGHPGGYRPDRGTVTRIGRILSVRAGAIVTDCALIGGDSGGPLFDIAGRLIAVHSRIGNDVSDNLHVPIDNYEFSWARLYNGESWGFLPGFRPVLGVQGTPEGEARIVTVGKDSPAEKAGIRPDDVIERFGNVSITDFGSLRAAVEDTMPGERVRILLKRGGDRYRVSVEIGRAD